MLGIGSNSRHADQAWDFIAWTLSEQAQVDVVAKNRYVTVRSDLDGNVYAQQDPRLVTFTQIARKGQTPYAVAFGKTFNDPNGPWISAVADAVFGTGDVGAALDRHNVSITGIVERRLSDGARPAVHRLPLRPAHGPHGGGAVRRPARA